VASFFMGMGGETFAHTLHGNCLVVTGLIILLRLILPLNDRVNPLNAIVVLQFWIAIIGISNLFQKPVNLILLTIAGIGGLYVIMSAALKAEKREKEKNLK
jgi:hypothetical protein